MAEPDLGSTLPRRAIVWTIIAVIILGGGLIATMVALKRAQNWAARQDRSRAQIQVPGREGPSAVYKAVSGGVEIKGFGISPVRLEKAPGGTLSHATGSATNLLARPRGRVSLSLDLFDEGGGKIGIAMDSISGVESRGVWDFRAAVLLTNATRATVNSINEEP